MAQNQAIRVRPKVLEADLKAYTALQGIANYQPLNQAYARGLMDACQASLLAAQKTTVHAEGALATARDEETAVEWKFHNIMLGVKEQVIAQFGSDSNEAQLLGLKKKSERKAPVRKNKSAS